MRRLLIVLMLAVTALSACTTKPAPSADCTGTSCPTDSPTDSPPPTSPTPGDPEYVFWPEGVEFPPLPVNESLRSIRKEECVGFSGSIYVPIERFEGRIPDDFEALPTFGQGTHGSVVAFGLVCNRMTVGEDVFEGYSELFLAPAVDPKNESWDPGGLSSNFVYDWFVDSEEAANALAAIGIAAREALFQISRQPSGGETVWDWRVDDGVGNYRFAYAMAGLPAISASPSEFSWVGSEHHLRGDVSSQFQIEQSAQVVPVVMGGQSNTMDLVGRDVAQMGVAPLVAFDSTTIMQTELFNGTAA